jgi:hypothetical protein
MKVNVSVDMMRGLGLAVWAAQQEHPRVVIYNKALQQWLGMRKVHTPRIEALAKGLQSIFYDYRIGADRNTKGHTLTLYLNKNNPLKELKFLPVINDLSTIDFHRNNLAP